MQAMQNSLNNAQTLKLRQSAIAALPPLRDIICKFDLCAQKSLGQNFLLDMNVTDKIVSEAMYRDGGSWEGVHLFEIGPGPGGLTRSLLKSDAQHVTAIEFDSRAIEALGSLVTASQGNLTLMAGDALECDISSFDYAPKVIVANLPYNIATPLLIGWLKDIRRDVAVYRSMSLMFQKEVAQRIVAKPGTRSYGRLSVMAQWLCRVERLYDLPARAFTPPPKVDSCVVYFSPRQELQNDEPSFAALESIVASAFNQRRKMIRSSLKNYMPALKALDIDVQKRAENLTVGEFVAISSFCEENLF
ncbi:MAG: 16S rRNA (adenine(1518)-N(6)/adenine(1519)-N(6))-dimethyltransferase RsmA [Alphaproteobacteria bacterium]